MDLEEMGGGKELGEMEGEEIALRMYETRIIFQYKVKHETRNNNKKRLRSIKNFQVRLSPPPTICLFLCLQQILYTGVVVYAPALALNEGELLGILHLKISEFSALKKCIDTLWERYSRGHYICEARKVYSIPKIIQNYYY